MSLTGSKQSFFTGTCFLPFLYCICHSCAKELKWFQTFLSSIPTATLFWTEILGVLSKALNYQVLLNRGEEHTDLCCESCWDCIKLSLLYLLCKGEKHIFPQMASTAPRAPDKCLHHNSSTGWRGRRAENDKFLWRELFLPKYFYQRLVSTKAKAINIGGTTKSPWLNLPFWCNDYVQGFFCVKQSQEQRPLGRLQCRCQDIRIWNA